MGAGIIGAGGSNWKEESKHKIRMQIDSLMKK